MLLKCCGDRLARIEYKSFSGRSIPLILAICTPHLPLQMFLVTLVTYS